MVHRTAREKGIYVDSTERRIYSFHKKNMLWYIAPPADAEKEEASDEEEMLAGADEMLDMIAAGKKQIRIELDREAFDGADVLELEELCDAPFGGGYYSMSTFNGKELNRRMWLCDVLLFVFGDLPERVYVKRIFPRNSD